MQRASSEVGSCGMPVQKRGPFVPCGPTAPLLWVDSSSHAASPIAIPVMQHSRHHSIPLASPTMPPTNSIPLDRSALGDYPEE